MRTSETWPRVSQASVRAMRLAAVGAEVGGDARRAGHQVVAGDDGDQVAVAGVHAVDVAADLGLVHDVVVVERGEVHQLERRRRRAGPRGWPGARRSSPRRSRAAGAGACRRRAMRCVVTESRYASPKTTDSASSGFEAREVVFDRREPADARAEFTPPP